MHFSQRQNNLGFWLPDCLRLSRICFWIILSVVWSYVSLSCCCRIQLIHYIRLVPSASASGSSLCGENHNRNKRWNSTERSSSIVRLFCHSNIQTKSMSCQGLEGFFGRLNSNLSPICSLIKHLLTEHLSTW